ncbi:MAG: aldo/keto reductase [Chloroflexota bacterium]|nr:aldo/keto reductase [Chloroflexota bacterium]
MFRSGIDQGINCIDTAYPYHLGESKKIIGLTLKDGYRERVHLVSKLFMPLVRTPELSVVINSFNYTEYIDYSNTYE